MHVDKHQETRGALSLLGGKSTKVESISYDTEDGEEIFKKYLKIRAILEDQEQKIMESLQLQEQE